MAYPVGHPWAKKEPDPPYDEDGHWLMLPQGRFYLTAAYIRGVRSCLANLAAAYRTPDPKVFWAYPRHNPYNPGPAFAQFNYGYSNQAAGAHSNCQALFTEPVTMEPTF